MSFEAWLDFRRGEHYTPPTPLCHWCGEPCSGDTTTTIDVDGARGERPVCDDESACD